MPEKDTVFAVPEDQYVEPTKWAAHTRKSHYRLDGLALTVDGKVTQTKLFEFLQTDLHDYTDLETSFTEEDAKYIARQLRHLSTGLNAVVPIICGGPRCPFREVCPLMAIGKVPVGRQCLIEKELIALWTQQYIQEYNVSPEDRTKLSMVMELAELDIYDYRATILLSKEENQTLLVDETVGVGNDGEPITAKRVSQAWEAKERIKRRKLQLQTALVGTPQERYKKQAALKKQETADPSTVMADLRERLDKLSVKQS